MRSLTCLWQRVVKTGTQLDFLAIDQDTNTVYGCYNNIILKLDYNAPQVLLHHELADDTKISDIHWLPSHRALFVVMNVTTLALFYPDTKTLEEVVVIEDGVACAQWAPDDGVCVIVTGSGKLMLMSEEFDCIKDVDAKPEGFGSEHQTQVGWGSKDTQFHGSAGKDASNQPVFATPTPISVNDTEETRVSWRGDGQYFSVSTVDSRGDQMYRVIRIWTREGLHTSTNEPAPGLEDSLSWKPSGNLIATTATSNNLHQVVFLERNGLRHGEFPLTLTEPNTAVSGVQWNCNSSVLAVVYEGLETSHVMLYTVSNYAWQLKQHYTYDVGNITLLWDPEEEFRFHITVDTRYICYQLSSIGFKCSNTTTLVIDDKQVLLTPMSKMCIPPPMSHCQLTTESTCNLISCLGDDVWLLCNDRTIYRFTNVSVSPGGARHPDEAYAMEKEFPLEAFTCIRHLVMVAPNKAFCVTVVNDTDALLTLELSDKEVFVVSCMMLEDTVVNVAQHPGTGTVVMQMFSGELFELHEGMLEPWGNQNMRECVQFCEMAVAAFSDEVVVIGRTHLNHLYMDTRLWSYDCTSYSLHRTHLLLTSHTHTLQCVSLNQPAHVARTTEGVVDTGIRTLERGARLVVSDPATSRVVLQMPRGNLELIHPRPLLLTYLTDLISSSQYKSVFEEVRKHRVNMNFVYDYHPEQFLANLSGILSELSSSYLELFVAELCDEDTTLTMYSFMGTVSTSPGDKVKTVCRALIDAITTSDNMLPWINTVVSCYVKIQDIPAGLLCIKNTYDSHPTEGEGAIKYMLILTDDEALFNHALSTYDLELVLTIAQFTQKDPKEYLIFLNELKALDETYRKFKISQHLRKDRLALESLVQCEGRFEEVCEFVTQHDLHAAALASYPSTTEEFKTIGRMFAEKLKEKGSMEEAGIMFGQCGILKESLSCLRHTTQSHLALSIAAQLNLAPDQVSGVAEQLADNLKRDGNYREAAKLFERYCDNADEAVEVLCEGGLFSDALEISATRKRVDLMSDIISSLQLQAGTTHALLLEKQTDVKKFLERIDLVRKKRSMVGTGFEDMDHSDLYSDATSMTATSAASSNASRRSAKSSKGRRKLEKKKYSLKEGSKYEYFAIQEAFKQIMTFLKKGKSRIEDMVNILLLQGFREDARKLLCAQQELVSLVNASIETIWPAPKSDVVEEEEEEGPGEVEPVSYPPGFVLAKWSLQQFVGS